MGETLKQPHWPYPPGAGAVPLVTSPKDESAGPATSPVTLDLSHPLPGPQFSQLYSGVRWLRTFRELVAVRVL